MDSRIDKEMLPDDKEEEGFWKRLKEKIMPKKDEDDDDDNTPVGKELNVFDKVKTPTKMILCAGDDIVCNETASKLFGVLPPQNKSL